MSTLHYPFEWRFVYNPRFWPTWLVLGSLWLSTRLPYRVLLKLGYALGAVLWVLGRERRTITRVNLQLCFPEYDHHALQQLARQVFYSAGMAVFETALGMWGSARKIAPLLHIEGLEHVQQARRLGKGVILIAGHYTTLEMGGHIMAKHTPELRPTYKHARDPVFNWLLVHSRIQRHGQIVDSSNMRAILRELKRNNIIWYAPDQDFGLKSSVFAPFMGVATATLTLTARLASASAAPVLPWYCERLPDAQGYRVRIGAPLTHFPSGDDVQDAAAINRIIETQIRRTPDQYLWGHRRFKTRPPGEPIPYPSRRDWRLRRYTEVNALLALPYLLYTLWLAYRNRNSDFVRQRLTQYPPQPVVRIDLWFHAASVGEVLAVIPLIEALRQHYPQKKILCTTYTPTGGLTARRRLPHGVEHAYLPFDWLWCVKRFVARFQPRCAVVMETELWPNLHEYLYNRAIPVVIINGRVSARTFNTPQWLLQLSGRSAQYATRILARSDQDYQQFLKLGVQPERMETVGNIKFAILHNEPVEPIKLGKPYVLAASTHDDEELRLARLWRQLGISSHLLVIVPRHVHRGTSIAKQLRRLNLKLAIRSHQQTITAQTQIYMADTFGELRGFIAGSEFVFMGGSLVAKGGHNILEVGAQGKAVIFGPHMDNFMAERDFFLAENAAREINDEHSLGQVLRSWLADPSQPQAIGQRALAIMKTQSHILSEYTERLQQLIQPLLNDSRLS